MKTLHILKGGSGAGKGTRVCQLMEYLRAAGNNCETIHWQKGDKNIPVGKYFPALSLFVAGKYNISNKSGLTSWNGVDHLHSTFSKSEYVRDMLKNIVEKFKVQHMILEGEPMFLSDKYRPAFLNEFYQPDQLFIDYYLYDNRDQYDERIIGRSGKAAGDTGWQRCSQYRKEVETSRGEVTNPDTTHVSFSDISEDVHVFGLRWAREFNKLNGAVLDLKGLIQWCKDNPMTRKIGEADPLNKSSLW